MICWAISCSCSRLTLERGKIHQCQKGISLELDIEKKNNYSILSFISGAGYIGQRAIPVILTAILAKTAFVIYVCTVGKHIFINNVHL